MDDEAFSAWMAGQLASLPGVEAVTLGGSRALGTAGPASDWDFAIYYRDRFDPDGLRAKGWEGEVSAVGGWGGGVMNGGAWLTVDGRRVDVHYRDLTEVDHWCAEAEAGRFEKQLLQFYVAGIPTYVVMAELATGRVLSGDLSRPAYPGALAVEASRRWRADALASLAYAESALRHRGDTTVALANASRGLLEAAHSRMAARRSWVLNEKGLADAAGLQADAAALLEATSGPELLLSIETMRTAFG